MSSPLRYTSTDTSDLQPPKANEPIILLTLTALVTLAPNNFHSKFADIAAQLQRIGGINRFKRLATIECTVGYRQIVGADIYRLQSLGGQKHPPPNETRFDGSVISVSDKQPLNTPSGNSVTPSGISIAATAVDMNAHLPMVCNWLPDANVTVLSDVQSLKHILEAL